MTGSMALPELMAGTVAQLTQKMRTMDPVDREPQSCCYEEVPALEAGDGEAEVLEDNPGSGVCPEQRPPPPWRSPRG